MLTHERLGFSPSPQKQKPLQEKSPEHSEEEVTAMDAAKTLRLFISLSIEDLTASLATRSDLEELLFSRGELPSISESIHRAAAAADSSHGGLKLAPNKEGLMFYHGGNGGHSTREVISVADDFVFLPFEPHQPFIVGSRTAVRTIGQHEQYDAESCVEYARRLQHCAEELGVG